MPFVWELDNLPNIKIIIKIEPSETLTINWSKKKRKVFYFGNSFIPKSEYTCTRPKLHQNIFMVNAHNHKKKNWEGGEAPLIFGEGGDEEGVLTFQINTIFWYSLSMNSPSWTGTTIRALSMNTVLVRCWATWTLEGSLNLTKHTRVAVPRWTMGSLKNSHIHISQ